MIRWPAAIFGLVSSQVVFWLLVYGMGFPSPSPHPVAGYAACFILGIVAGLASFGFQVLTDIAEDAP